MTPVKVAVAVVALFALALAMDACSQQYMKSNHLMGRPEIMVRAATAR